MLDELSSVIDGLLTVDVDCLGADCLQESVVEFRKLTSLLAAAEARVVDRWDAETVWARDGSGSAGNRLARDAHCSPAVAGAVVKRARRLRTMPITTMALEAGEVSVDHVDVLSSVNRKPYEKRFAEGEEHLVGVAKQRWFDNFAKTVKYWKQAVDDDVSEKDAQQRYDERYFKARPTLGDMTDLQGRLDPVNGAIFTGELARLERAMFEADWAAAKAVHGLDTNIGHLARTAGQRNADALVEMARRSAAMEPGAVKARTLITILVGYETFAGRVCEMANGTVVTPGQVANLFHHRDGTPDDTIDAERVVFDGPSGSSTSASAPVNSSAGSGGRGPRPPLHLPRMHGPCRVLPHRPHRRILRRRRDHPRERAAPLPRPQRSTPRPPSTTDLRSVAAARECGLRAERRWPAARPPRRRCHRCLAQSR